SKKYETSIRRNASECINDGYFNGLLEFRGTLERHVELFFSGFPAQVTVNCRTPGCHALFTRFLEIRRESRCFLYESEVCAGRKLEHSLVAKTFASDSVVNTQEDFVGIVPDRVDGLSLACPVRPLA
ncbi:hypothetical protein, partial [Caballeronia telluris]|uniref:hypothetical protein n=1 Tax=Caballeronia telluris TaxID=326475 RepID=UPI001F3BD745